MNPIADDRVARDPDKEIALSPPDRRRPRWSESRTRRERSDEASGELAPPGLRGESRLGYFLKGLPAALALLVIGTLALMIVLGRNDATISRYLTLGELALRSDDSEEALICFTRLVEFDPARPEHVFGLAAAADQSGQAERAAALMANVAPRDRVGHPPAHLWMARRLLSSSSVSVDSINAAQSHLQRVLQAYPLNSDAHELLTRCYLATGRLDDARRHLAQSQNDVPELRLQVAQALIKSGNSPHGVTDAESLFEAFRRKAEAQPDDVRSRLNWAESAMVLQKMTVAEQILQDGQRLMPEGPYDRALAQLYLRWTETLPADDLGRLMRSKLLQQSAVRFEKTRPVTTELHVTLARIYLELERSPEAETHLQQGATERPELHLDLARLYSARGADDLARTEARAALDFYRSRLAATPSDRPMQLLAADAACLAGEYEMAVTWLGEGMSDTPDQATTAALGRVYIAWFDAIENAVTEVATPDRFELLQRALQGDAWNPAVVQRYLRLARRTDQNGERARENLKQMLVRGEAPASAHLLLGTDAMDRGNLELGRQHLEQAVRLEPRSIEAMNNLAWVLAHVEPPDLAGGLQIITAALEIEPQHVYLRDTRGRILAKMGSWTEALSDLEASAKALDGNRDFHQTIAEVYEKLGMRDLATAHRVRAAPSPTITKPSAVK